MDFVPSTVRYQTAPYILSYLFNPIHFFTMSSEIVTKYGHLYYFIVLIMVFVYVVTFALTAHRVDYHVHPKETDNCTVL